MKIVFRTSKRRLKDVFFYWDERTNCERAKDVHFRSRADWEVMKITNKIINTNRIEKDQTGNTKDNLL